MDMLIKLEKDSPLNGAVADTLLNNNKLMHHQQQQPMFNNNYQVLSHHSTTLDVEEHHPTRHSSGCDDSGVFLEDTPFTPDHLPTNLSFEGSYAERKSPEMRQYSIDSSQTGQDSDTERSDDLGLASSSIDSADDLDGDPLPSTLKIHSPALSPKKPPPVPPRKSFTNGNKWETRPPTNSSILVPDTFNSHRTNCAIETVQPRRQSENFKWKSEECLRSATETKWGQRNNEKSISVKERIAMFSEMESCSIPAKKDSNLQRFSSESNVKSAPSIEFIDKKSDKILTIEETSNDFSGINRDTRWYSMYSLPLSSATSQLDANREKESSKQMPYNEPQIKAISDDNIADISTVPLKVDTDYQKQSDKPIISNYPQTQLINNKRYNYGPFSRSVIRTTDDLLAKKNNPGGLLSIIDSRKQQPLAKLKGLVIPEKPLPIPNNKALPTIVSNDSLIMSTKTDLDNERDWKMSMLSSASYTTRTLPRTRTELATKVDNFDRESAKLAEPPWKTNITNGISLPNYSPAFKTRTLDLPQGVVSSLSPTPPSSITSPLSPPPSSPSSICSSNASSATSVATMQQNIFQFSLSHSKPVTPVLPEKPIMSPPSLPSDIEYEGDNSEDSSTSASPMVSKLSAKLSMSQNKKQHGSSTMYNSEYGKEKDYLKTHPLNNSYISTSEPRKITITSSAKKEKEYCSQKLNDYIENEEPNDTFSRHHRSHSNHKSWKTNNTSLPRDYRTNGKNNYTYECRSDISNAKESFPVSPPEINGSYGNKNGFIASSQDIRSAKFRAQPLFLNHASSTKVANSTNLDNQNFVNASVYYDANGRYEDQKTNISECEYIPTKSWNQNTDFRRSRFDSEDEDDSHSSLSHRTEDSRPTTDDYLSDATTDSFDKPLDPDLKPRRLSQQKVVLKASADSTDSAQKFKALAEKWETRKEIKSPPPPPPPAIPAPRKEQKTYAAPIPATSSFLSSIINSSSSNSKSTSSSLKLPPSLMPRYKESKSFTNDRKSQSDSKQSYETTWYENRSRQSSRDFSDSGSSTDTGSTYSRKMNTRDNRPTERSSNYGKQKYDFEFSTVEDAPLLKEDDVFFSEDDLVSLREKRESFDAISIANTDSYRDIKTKSRGEIPTSNMKMEPSDVKPHLKITETSLVNQRRESSYDHDDFDNSLKKASPERASDFNFTRPLSKSQASLRDPLESVRIQSSSYFSAKNSKSVSVSDIRKAFETQCTQNQTIAATKTPALPPRPPINEGRSQKQNGLTYRQPLVIDHKRLSSLDSTTSADSDPPISSKCDSVGSAGSISRDPYGSVTSLASTTSLISPQELQQLIDEANQSLEESGGNMQQEVQVIVLHREVPAGSIGITLAGGADYEVKEVSVHKVISGSLADRDGRIRKGDRVISINGRNLKGTTHREALDILKSPKPEVVLVIARGKGDLNGHDNGTSHDAKVLGQGKAREDFRMKKQNVSQSVKVVENESKESQTVCVRLQKDGAGLGFSLEGGKDSPLGDRPLLIKRIFKGGVADKDGHLNVGDEIVSVNGQPLNTMTRTEAWNFLKKLPEEFVLVRARKPVSCPS